MHNLFRNHNPFTVIALFIVAMLMKWQALSQAVIPETLSNHLLFGSLLKLLPLSAFAFTLLGILMVVLQALYLNFIAIKHKLFNQATYYPAFMYVLLTSLYPAFNFFSEPLLINWFVIMAIDVMLGFPKTLHPNKQIFNAGFLICIPLLIQFPTIGFFLLLLLAWLLLRSFRSAELVVLLSGYLLPVYFFVCVLYLIDQTGILKNIVEVGFDFHPLSSRKIYLAGTITGAGILLLTGFFAFQQLNSRMLIYVRRSWVLMFIYLAISVGVTMIAISAIHAEWVLVLPPLSLIASLPFFMENKRRLSTFMFYFSLAVLIFSQITFK